MPDHIILTLLPPHSPELNPVENVLQFMGDCIFNDDTTLSPMAALPRIGRRDRS
ncbi:hypothetical protein [Rhizobium gallicum]|uniref:hypothetical protein n=1 Tax=Rhizobium gallicum TaxID=56730 RepID=UPI0012EC1B0A|nr:hypothetical protein [Rhizobium gallicum]